MFVELKITSPESGLSSPPRICRSVLLPAPEAPTITEILFSSTSSEIDLRISSVTFSFDLKDLLILFALSITELLIKFTIYFLISKYYLLSTSCFQLQHPTIYYSHLIDSTILTL